MVLRPRRRAGRRRHEPCHAAPCEVSAAAHVPGEAVYLRLEGIAPSVAYRRDAAGHDAGRPVEVMAAKSSAAALARHPRRRAVRRQAAPSALAHVCCAVRAPAHHPYTAATASTSAISSTGRAASSGSRCRRRRMHPQAACAAPSRRGHATLVRAPDAVRAAVDVFQPQPAALAALSARVKAVLRPAPHPQSRPHVSGRLMQTTFHRRTARHAPHRGGQHHPAQMRALRLLHRHLPDLCAAGRRAR